MLALCALDRNGNETKEEGASSLSVAPTEREEDGKLKENERKEEGMKVSREEAMSREMKETRMDKSREEARMKRRKMAEQILKVDESREEVDNYWVQVMSGRSHKLDH